MGTLILLEAREVFFDVDMHFFHPRIFFHIKSMRYDSGSIRIEFYVKKYSRNTFLYGCHVFVAKLTVFFDLLKISTSGVGRQPLDQAGRS